MGEDDQGRGKDLRSDRLLLGTIEMFLLLRGYLDILEFTWIKTYLNLFEVVLELGTT